MSTSIWSKEYSLPSVKLDKITYTLVLILIPNIVFLFISIITETSRPLINVDYLLPVMLLLLNNRLCKSLGFISLTLMTIPDMTMFVFQIFPFMDLQGLLYLAPFLLEGPPRYLIFIGVILVYAITLPLSIKLFSKLTDFFHVLLVGGIVFIMSYFISTSDIEYKQGSGTTFGSNNNYVVASQTDLYLSIQDLKFVKAAGVTPSFSPTKYDRVVTKLEQPFNDKILLIVVESLGAWTNYDLQQKVIEPISQQQYLFDFYDTGIYEAPTSTIEGEIKELCAQDVKGYGLRLVDPNNFPKCLPKILADKGYQTTALHGANGKLYDRFSWYKKAGFKEFFFSESLHDEKRCSAFHGVCDDEIFPVIRNYFKEDRPALFHWMTLTSHAPYAKKDIYSKRVDCKLYEINNDDICRNTMMQSQFFEGLAKLNERPEMSGVEVVLIGDHLPPIVNATARFKAYKYLSVTWLHYKIK